MSIECIDFSWCKCSPIIVKMHISSCDDMFGQFWLRKLQNSIPWFCMTVLMVETRSNSSMIFFKNVFSIVKRMAMSLHVVCLKSQFWKISILDNTVYMMNTEKLCKVMLVISLNISFYRIWNSENDLLICNHHICMFQNVTMY